MLGLVLVLSLVLLSLGVLITDKSYTSQYSSAFECGISSNYLVRIPFSFQYWLVALVFVVFDLEVILLVNVIGYSVISSAYVLFMLVLLVLLLGGLIYEWSLLTWYK